MAGDLLAPELGDNLPEEAAILRPGALAVADLDHGSGGRIPCDEVIKSGHHGGSVDATRPEDFKFLLFIFCHF